MGSVTPFHIRIPGLAWFDLLNGNRGGYDVSKMEGEGLQVWRGREVAEGARTMRRRDRVRAVRWKVRSMGVRCVGRRR